MRGAVTLVLSSPVAGLRTLLRIFTSSQFFIFRCLDNSTSLFSLSKHVPILFVLSLSLSPRDLDNFPRPPVFHTQDVVAAAQDFLALAVFSTSSLTISFSALVFPLCAFLT